MSPHILVVLTLFILVFAAGARASDYSLWIEPSATKVLRDAKPSAKAPAGADLCAARNEWESFQICLRGADKAKVRIELSELRRRGGGTIPASKIWTGLVCYVPIMTPPVPYPDPLPPLRPFELQPDTTQPIWVTVKVPERCRAGDYSGSVKVTVGNSTRKVPVKLHVWDFTLPKTPRCVTAFGISPEYIYRTHGVAGDAAKQTDLHRKYYEMLLEHKISPYSIPVDLMSEEAKAYLEDSRMTSYMIPYLQDDAKQKELIQYLIANDWFRKGYLYPLDEPVNKQAYDNLAAICQRLRTIEPKYRLVSPYFRGPDWDESKTIYDYCVGQVNIWCPNEQYLDLQARTRPFLQARKNAGEDIWWYVCCGPGRPYTNFFVDYSGLMHRMLFWHQKRENIAGLLYWSTTYWNPVEGCDDPWTSMMTVKSINPNIFGDGSLLYPGKAVGIDGPVASQRLEIIRDGIEDFDYLCLADELIGPGTAAKYIQPLAKSLAEYELDPAKLEKARRKLGTALEAVAKSRMP